MTRSRLPLLAALALGALWASPRAARAQSIPSPYEYIEPAQSVAIFGGYLLADEGEYGIGPESGPLVGLRYAGRFADPVTGIVRLAAAPSERGVFARSGTTDPDAPPDRIGQSDAVILMADAGLRLNLTGPRTWHSIAPHVEVTGGIVSLSSSRIEAEGQLPENQLVDLGPSFAVNVGAGADWFPTERISVVIAAQGRLWRQTTPAGLTGTEREDSEWTRNLGVTLGAAFHF